MYIEVKVIEIIKEDAYANASNVGGMGNVTAAQPSLNAGSTIGSSFTSGGGTIGSGDVGSGYPKKYQGKKEKGKKNKGAGKAFQQKQDWTRGGDKTPKRQKLQTFSDFNKVTHLNN